ncbi:MAG: hydroxyacylglutathione hydrolase, partial [Gammaproteobacteria bacterium]
MYIEALHAFSDNFIWCLTEAGRRQAVVVDPGDAAPVIQALEGENLELAAVLVTHKHGDHVGGIRSLKARWPQAVVYGPRHESIPGIDRPVGEGDRIRPEGLETHFAVFEVPGHTEGHVAYFAAGEDPVLFCGDTLFSIGCGRVFSGTFAQLHDSLLRLRALPGATRVYCAHEY